MTWVSKPVITMSGMVIAFVLSVSTAIIASIFPSLRASRLEIAEALRQCN
jgi:ABC-type antimicrobial peptide transport system permease subunit